MRDTDILLPQGIHRAGLRQARKLGAITADAFRHDPFNLWLFGNFAGIENLFRLQAKRIYAPRGFCYTAGNEGACMWMLPGGDNSFGLADYAAFLLPTLLRCGPRAVRRGIRTGKLMERRHPRFQHAYLFSIGVGATSRLDQQMPREQQRRHSDPVRADVERQPRRGTGLSSPGVAR